MDKLWKYMTLELNPDDLPTMKELIAKIVDDGGTDAALAKLREKSLEESGCDLIWRFPISEGDAAGGFIMPVREGILWIPYYEIVKEDGEILLTDDAILLDEEGCKNLIEDFASYAEQLCDVLRQAAFICRDISQEDT